MVDTYDRRVYSKNDFISLRDIIDLSVQLNEMYFARMMNNE